MVSSTTYKALRMMDLDPGEGSAYGAAAGQGDMSLSSLMDKLRESNGAYSQKRQQAEQRGSRQVCA